MSFRNMIFFKSTRIYVTCVGYCVSSYNCWFSRRNYSSVPLPFYLLQVSQPGSRDHFSYNLGAISAMPNPLSIRHKLGAHGRNFGFKSLEGLLHVEDVG
jgi:hypothetical protein